MTMMRKNIYQFIGYFCFMITSLPNRTQNMEQPIVEKIRVAWIIMSTYQEDEDFTLMYTGATPEDYI